MPELPEVETVRKVLEGSIVNRKIEDVIVKYPPIISDDSDTFKKIVIGKYISIITLNVNGLNTPIKRQTLAEWILK